MGPQKRTYGTTALMIASQQRGRQIQGQNRWYHGLDLILASQLGPLKVVRVLCEAGANKDKARPDGATALINASATGTWRWRVFCARRAPTRRRRELMATQT
eukprot:5218586-Heterocapsa_arctica.AAC.1